MDFFFFFFFRTGKKKKKKKILSGHVQEHWGQELLQKCTNVSILTDSGLGCTILVTPGAVPLHLTPGVSDPDQLNRPTSVIHLKSDLKNDFILFSLSLPFFPDDFRKNRIT